MFCFTIEFKKPLNCNIMQWNSYNNQPIGVNNKSCLLLNSSCAHQFTFITFIVQEAQVPNFLKDLLSILFPCTINPLSARVFFFMHRVPDYFLYGYARSAGYSLHIWLRFSKIIMFKLFLEQTNSNLLYTVNKDILFYKI